MLSPVRQPSALLRAAAAAVVLVLAGCSSDDLEQAGRLLERGDFLGAQRLYERVLERRPRDFTAHYGMGMAQCAEAITRTELGLATPDDWYPAIYHMTIAAGIDSQPRALSTLAILHYNLGASYRRNGETDAAIARLEQAVGYDSTLLKATNLLGAMCHERGDFDKAACCYRRALAAHPDYPLAHFNLGALAWARGDFAAAHTRFERAASLAPGNGHFRRWLEKAKKRIAAQKREGER